MVLPIGAQWRSTYIVYTTTLPCVAHHGGVVVIVNACAAVAEGSGAGPMDAVVRHAHGR